jgi:hypothetical protein
LILSYLTSFIFATQPNERINQVEPLAKQAHTEPISKVPPVIQLDGIWVTITSQQEKIKPDKRKRQRKQRTGRKMVILVALGFWPDGMRQNGEQDPKQSFTMV